MKYIGPDESKAFLVAAVRLGDLVSALERGFNRGEYAPQEKEALKYGSWIFDLDKCRNSVQRFLAERFSRDACSLPLAGAANSDVASTFLLGDARDTPNYKHRFSLDGIRAVRNYLTSLQSEILQQQAFGH